MNAPLTIAPSGWRVCKLGELTRVVGGSTPASNDSNYWGGDIVWITPTDLGQLTDPLIKTSARKITDAGYRSCAAEMLPIGTVVMSSRAPIGHLGIAGVPLCTNQGCKSFVPGDSVDSQFLFHALSYHRHAIEALGSGNTFKEVSKSDLEAFAIALPLLDEQRRIVARLDAQLRSLIEIRDAQQKQLTQTQRLRNAIFLSSYGGVRPVSAHINEKQAPLGWGWSSLCDIAQLESGHTPSRNHPEWWGGDIPWLALPDIREVDGKKIFDTAEKTNDSGLQNSSARLLPKGTVAMSRTASVAFVTVMGRAMATSQDFVNWICGPDLDPWFLAWALIASRSYLLDLASGAIHKTIYMPTVESLRLCHPSIDEQKRIVASLRDKLACLDRAAASLDEEHREIENLRPALLRAAFSGQL